MFTALANNVTVLAGSGGGNLFNAITHLASEFRDPANTACLTIAGLAVIIAGGMYILGTPRMHQMVRQHIVGIFIGVLLVMGGKKFIDWLASEDKGAWNSTIMPLVTDIKIHASSWLPFIK